jgi:aminoglycoside/choline kinase family phosphotransferase
VVLVLDERKESLEKWLRTCTSFKQPNLETASADASFRRYFRISELGKSWIVMDAPPDLEPCEPFVRIAEQMQEAGINVPKIIAQDLKLGFMVLSDFGDIHYQDVLDGPDREELYDLAVSEILKFQSGLSDFAETLPAFDREWQLKELDIFREWCLPGIEPTEYEQVVAPLANAIEAIPKSFMHRDFHCRNLLVPSSGKIGVIDFQGAMLGPVTYDLVSLLRDCYVENDEGWITEEVSSFQQALEQGKHSMAQISDEEFLRWFDLTGLQRHLKCIGIFHRLKIRDGKDGFLKDIPLVRRYVETVLERNPELSGIQKLYEQAQMLA